jgi:hypothetical protein
MRLDGVGGLPHRRQAAVGGPEEQAAEEALRVPKFTLTSLDFWLE